MATRTISVFLLTAVFLLNWVNAGEKKGAVLTKAKLKTYVEQFNAGDEELYANIPNQDALAFLEKSIPLFECPDKDFERTYYFRWWTYRKHIKKTPDGYVITEFLPTVPWSGKHNTISCPAAHHYYEGRWLHNPKYLDDYSVFWLRKGGEPRRYSFWIADAYYARHLVTPNRKLLVDLLPDLIKNYKEWERAKRGRAIMFHQIDDRDGMEVAIGGSGYRATINSYMYGDAIAIARIATLAGQEEIAKEYTAKAEEIKTLVLTKLWDDKAKFFKVMRRRDKQLVDVREQHGYTPWYFNLPQSGKGYEIAWKQLMDPKGFHAPYGPTTAEQRHPRFSISYRGHECQWNGPSWPLSTSITLTALANVLNNYKQDAITKKDYFETLTIYTQCHKLKRENGKIVPWIDENINPHTGDWISRTRLKQWKNGTWDKRKGGKERGKDYNHSSYNDLIITGLVGLRPDPSDTIKINPLLPQNTWDYFCLDNLLYRGHYLTIIWDRTGQKYGKGKGLILLVNGRKAAESPTLSGITGKLK